MLWKGRLPVASCAEETVNLISFVARRSQPPCCSLPDTTRWCCARVLDVVAEMNKNNIMGATCLVQDLDIPRSAQRRGRVGRDCLPTELFA